MAAILPALIVALFGGLTYMSHVSLPGEQDPDPNTETEGDIIERIKFKRSTMESNPLWSYSQKQIDALTNPATYSQVNRPRPGEFGQKIDIDEARWRQAEAEVIEATKGAQIAFSKKHNVYPGPRQVGSVPKIEVLTAAGLNVPNNEALLDYPLLKVKRSTGAFGGLPFHQGYDRIGRINGMATADTSTKLWSDRGSTIARFVNPFNPSGEVTNKVLMNNQTSVIRPKPFVGF